MLLLLAACAGSRSGADDTGTLAPIDVCDQTPEGLVSLPADDAVHDAIVEWWYWTGHLSDDAGNRYGFEEVFFLFAFGGETRHLMGNTALTDVSAQAFAYDAEYETGYTPNVLLDGFSFSQAGWSAEGGDGHDSLAGSAGEYSWELQLDAVKAPVLQHGDGYTEYDFGGDTFYYSRSRMDVSGSVVTVDGPLDVTGTGWFDHQWGDLLVATSIGWDWFALQLDDGREIMVFLVRDGDTPSLVGGSVSDASCHVTEVPAEDVAVVATGEWTSEASGCTWPSGWTVNVEGETFTLTPSVPDQELYNSENTYWEGEVTVSGSATGLGYVELTGYCG